MKEFPILSVFHSAATAPVRNAAPEPVLLVFDACRVGAVLFVQAMLAVVTMFGAASVMDWLTQLAGVALGALTGLYGCTMLAWSGLLEPAPWWGSAFAGALLSAVLVAALVMRAKGKAPATTAARLAELQARIRPHFLFNTLNSAIALVRAEPRKAERLLEDPSASGADIRASTERRGSRVVIKVSNTTSGVNSTGGSGTALDNVRQRLSWLHDVQAQFQSGVKNSVFRVRIEVPI